MTGLEQKRSQALENLVMFYLGNEGSLGAKKMQGPVSVTNSFRIEFDKPPLQSEIEHLILILKAHQPVLPQNRDERTPAELVNEAFVAAGSAELERKEVEV